MAELLDAYQPNLGAYMSAVEWVKWVEGVEGVGGFEEKEVIAMTEMTCDTPGNWGMFSRGTHFR